MKLYFYRIHAGMTSVATSKTPVGAMERSLMFIERYSMARNWVPDTMPLILKKAVWFGISAYTWLNDDYAEKYSQGYGTIREFFITHKDEIASSPLIDKPRKTAARFIISGNTWPFRITSSLRPAMKKLINKLQRR